MKLRTSNIARDTAGHGIGTLVLMADASWRPINSIQVGDQLAFGNLVTGHSIAKAGHAWWLMGMELSGGQLVFRSGLWAKARDMTGGRLITVPAGSPGFALVQLATTQRVLIVREAGPPLITADCDALDPHPDIDTPDKVLAILNGPMAGDRNTALAHWEQELLENWHK